MSFSFLFQNRSSKRGAFLFIFCLQPTQTHFLEIKAVLNAAHQDRRKTFVIFITEGNFFRIWVEAIIGAVTNSLFRDRRTGWIHFLNTSPSCWLADAMATVGARPIDTATLAKKENEIDSIRSGRAFKVRVYSFSENVRQTSVCRVAPHNRLLAETATN